tara:strand:- start:3074 stop:3355 length:282 start_codon:yes stop_codon:yes gene_type:complete
MSRQQSLFEWRDRIVYLASSRTLSSSRNWLGNVVLYTTAGDLDYLIPFEDFKLWYESTILTTLLPVSSVRLVDAIEQGTGFIINGRVNDGSPF